MQSKLTLIGLYNYDNTLLDSLSFPAGIEKDLAISQILLRCGEFELLYPNLEFLKSACQIWSRKHYRTFEKWVRALAVDYNPLDNYDRHEEYTDTMNGGETSNGSDTHSGSDSVNGSDAHSGSDTITQSGTDTGSISNSTTGSTSPAQTTTTDTKSVSAFDSAAFQNKEQDVSGLVVNTAGSDSSTTTGSTSTVYGKSEETAYDSLLEHDSTTTYDSKVEHDNETTRNHTITHDAHLYGNIGVTTSQEMLKAELDIQRFNIYENIADIFCDEFCIMIY